jgi:phosphomannomutase
MITASHLPYNRNGFKFFTKNGGLDKKDIREILEIASGISLNKGELVSDGKEIIGADLISRYSSHLVDIIRREINSSVNYEKPLSGLHIIADAGNGAGGFFPGKVLEVLGADTTGSQFLEPDGMFPNHEPNPENKDAMESIKDATIKTGADLGIIFDTDVDRSAVVYKGGTIINRNTLIALMSHIVLKSNPGSTIVTDSVTSDGLSEYIESRGGIHHRFMRGYKNVINESVRLNDNGTPSHLAIETSGHGAFKENFFLDDGAYIVVKTLIYLAKLKEENKELIDVLSDLKEPKEELEIRVKIKLEDFKEYGLGVISDLEKLVSATSDFTLPKVNHEGIRINVTSDDSSGWLLVRMSLHDPVLPINIESDVVGGSEKIKERLYDFLKEYDMLDLSGFNIK